LSINTNINAAIAGHALAKNERAMHQVMERLATGLRINSAADDAAGLAISSKMTSQINGLSQAVRNAQDAMSMLATADGAMIEITSMIQRMRELSIQAINDTNTASDRRALDLEYQALKSEIDRIAQNTQWNGRSFFNGRDFTQPATFHVGSNASQTISVDLGSLSTRTLGQVATNSGAWTQLGSDIDGEAAGDVSGIVSSSADGKTVAIGAPYNDGNGSDSGHVRVFDWDGTAWVQKGADIDGEAAGDIASLVSLSADGNTMVIGAPLNDGNGETSGHVRIYDWDGVSWTQRGADIDGEAAGDQSGLMASISADGNTVSIGASYNGGLPNTNANGYWAGHARIFDWDGSTWSQRGADIDGEAMIDFSGRRTQLSADGNTIAVAGFLNDGNGSDSGHVRMYDWNGSSWAQRGRDIDGSSAGDQSGYSISLNADGNTLAVGSILNDTGGKDSGQTRIFDWNGTAWQQRGADIYGESLGDVSSRGLSLSADGNTIAIGAPYNDGNGADAGHVRLYDWNDTTWIPRGLDIDGENAGDFSGWAISLNGNGNIVAIGAVSDDGNGVDSGQTRVYEWSVVGNSKVSVAHTQISSFASATGALSSLDLAVSEINTRRATFGAAANRLEYAAENLSNVIMNTQAARSRVMDTDYAKEATELARTQIIQQAATAMLAQANVQAKQVLTLLEGESRS
jgi:flagellin-like hook-associated protein FlgL